MLRLFPPSYLEQPPELLGHYIYCCESQGGFFITDVSRWTQMAQMLTNVDRCRKILVHCYN